MSGIVGGAGSKSGVIGTTEIDYETGSFTPTIEFGGAFSGGSYLFQVGKYTKIGNRCFFNCSVRVNAGGSSSGGTVIQGLPFTSLNLSDNYSPCAIELGAMPDTTQTMYAGRIDANTSYITIKQLAADGEMPPMASSQFSATQGFVMFTGSYEVEGG